MKKKLKIINLLLSLVVLFAILFPAVHSYTHIAELSASNHSVEKHGSTKNYYKISSQEIEKCLVCDLKLSSFTEFSFTRFNFHEKTAITQGVFFYFKPYTLFFKGCLFSLRAPPGI